MNLLNIFEMIILSSIIGSIIVLMILILKTIFRNSLSPSFHYYIWLILLVKLIVPFGPQTPLTIPNINENIYVKNSTNENTPKTQINISNQIETNDLGYPFSTNSSQSSDKSMINNAINIPIKPEINLEKTLCFIWLLGVASLILLFVLSLKKLREIINSSINNIDNSHKDILLNCIKNMNIRKDVELLYSTKISSPSLCGIITPKIIMPSNIAANIDDEEFKYIVMHELTHLKNKDNLINLVISLLSVIYWFNPILLYGFHKMKQDCEISCDNKVISYLDKGENFKYGNSIIKILELYKLNCNPKMLIGTTSMFLNSSEIKRRIIMISKYKKVTIRNIILGTVVFAFIVVIAISLNTSSVSSAENNVDETSLETEKSASVTKKTIENTSIKDSSQIENAASNTENVVNDTSNEATTLISADIVIYNSHAHEAYPSGMKVTEVGASLNDKLLKEGFNSYFIECNPATNYYESYKNTRDIITNNVEDYSNTILIDLHRDANLKDERKLTFVLCKENPRYEANKRFVDNIIQNIETSNQVETEIYTFKNGDNYFNEDLSDNSVLIEVGTHMSSDNNVDACVYALVSALKNIQETASN